MTTTIDQKYGGWNGQWRHVQIPLKNFVDRGSWDGVWLNPQGLFDRSAVDRFEIVSEHHDFIGVQFSFDNIRVTKPAGAR